MRLISFYFEHDGSIVSAIAFIPIEGLLYECSAFTDPEFRGHGLFLGFWMRESMNFRKIRSWIFMRIREICRCQPFLEAIGAEMNSEEHMMKLLPENFSIIDCRSSQTGSDVSALDLIADIHSECLNLDGTLTLRFHSDHAVINFSVFPFPLLPLWLLKREESCRGKGYGAKFLSTVLAQLLNGNAAAIEAFTTFAGNFVPYFRREKVPLLTILPHARSFSRYPAATPRLSPSILKQGSVSPKPCAAISIKLYLIGTAVDFTLPQSPIRSLHRILIELEQIFLTLPVLSIFRRSDSIFRSVCAITSAHSFSSSLISLASSTSFLYFIWWSRLAQKSIAMVRI